jgi:hypothetical protein
MLPTWQTEQKVANLRRAEKNRLFNKQWNETTTEGMLLVIKMYRSW